VTRLFLYEVIRQLKRPLGGLINGILKLMSVSKFPVISPVILKVPFSEKLSKSYFGFFIIAGTISNIEGSEKLGKDPFFINKSTKNGFNNSVSAGKPVKNSELYNFIYGSSRSPSPLNV
jgi:hypothetical protein